MMTADTAITLLERQVCPACGESTAVEIEHDDERPVAFEGCKNKHVWPYDRFSEDRSVNAFEGEFAPTTIDEHLDLYGCWRMAEPIFVVTTTPGPHVEFVELEREDGSLADVTAPYAPYPGKEGLWRLGPLYHAAEVELLRREINTLREELKSTGAIP